MDLARYIIGGLGPEQEKAHRETLRRLYPTLTEDQLTEAQENLDRYLQTAVQIFERVKNDPDFHAKLEQFEQKRQKLLKEQYNS
jgi:hypothetical protein